MSGPPNEKGRPGGGGLSQGSGEPTGSANILQWALGRNSVATDKVVPFRVRTAKRVVISHDGNEGGSYGVWIEPIRMTSMLPVMLEFERFDDNYPAAVAYATKLSREEGWPLIDETKGEEA